MSDGVEWNPSDFMKDAPVSRLAQACMDNPKVTLPDGTHIVTHETGYSICNRNGHEIEQLSGVSKDVALSVAQRALDASAGSRHPHSVGGRRRFTSFDKVKEGKSIDDRRPLV